MNMVALDVVLCVFSIYRYQVYRVEMFGHVSRDNVDMLSSVYRSERFCLPSSGTLVFFNANTTTTTNTLYVQLRTTYTLQLLCNYIYNYYINNEYQVLLMLVTFLH